MKSDYPSFNLFSFRGKMRILHLSWFAFFCTFVVWFNHAPLLVSIRESMGLSNEEINTLLTLNVALTIPARTIIGMLVDKFGPRLIYSSLLFISSFLCLMFAFADSFQTLALARFLLGFAGAGFVIGIRLIGEWFPARQVGLVEGIYGGWGNFGSAAAAMTLPPLALITGGDEGWRYAVATTGVTIFIYAFIYYFSVSDAPKGFTYFKPNKNGGLEVTSKADFFFYLLMNIPLYATLALLSWNLSKSSLITTTMLYGIFIALSGMYLFQCLQIYMVNADIFKKPVPVIHQYSFKQVAILNLAYFVTFGSELAVVSMLPLFFLDTFGISQVAAGILASGYAFMNLVARPAGGWISDRFGRKKSLMILMAGLAAGYFLMGQINGTCAIPPAVITIMCCSFFVQAGEGAVFAMVPLVKRRLTGQIAGMTGAYGNVGAVVFLTLLSFVTPQIFFAIIACTALVTIATVVFLDEPEGDTAELLPDGTVQMIEVA
ncbi:MAG: NarK family nitrate/nitrite MFS transporter [Gammaproteobacteria bacterium]